MFFVSKLKIEVSTMGEKVWVDILFVDGDDADVVIISDVVEIISFVDCISISTCGVVVSCFNISLVVS